MDSLKHRRRKQAPQVLTFCSLIGQSFGVERTYNLCQEMSRNEYFLQSEARV
jgi:hypothetical protein